MELESIKKKLNEIDATIYHKSIDIFDRNIRLGFSEKISLLSLFLMYILKLNSYSKKVQEELTEIIEQNIVLGLDKIHDLQIIHEIEQLKEENIKNLYCKKEPKIYEILLTKITEIDLALALMSEKIYVVNNKEFKEDKQNEKFFLDLIENVYLPMSHIFGIHKYITMYEDFLISYKHPKEYKEVLELCKKKLNITQNELNNLIQELEKFRLNKNEIIKGRIKSPTSVFKKIYDRNKKPEEIMDFVAIRIITNTISDCYSWLGYIYKIWEPVLSRYKNYILNPKDNDYKSIHIVVITKIGPVEIQIRTHNMHKFAEYGVAAHWIYKNKNLNSTKYNKLTKIINHKDSFLGKGYIFVYTPKKDIILLDKGSCVVDFAYAIHTELGNTLDSAEINGLKANLNTILKDKDLIKIYTFKNKLPSKKWLDFVKTNKAKEKICEILNIKHETKKKLKESQNRLWEKIIVAKCCNPFIDENVGIYKTTKRKLILHSKECLEKNNLEYFYTGESIKKNFLLSKTIEIKTRKINKDLINEISKLINVELNIKKEKKAIIFSMNFENKDQYLELKKELLKIENINEINLI